jgi:hypothetical protein
MTTPPVFSLEQTWVQRLGLAAVGLLLLLPLSLPAAAASETITSVGEIEDLWSAAQK